MSTFHLPDVGEGLTEAEITRWLVAEGDVVAVNQPFVEIETAKSLVELPSPYEGTVTALRGAEGDTLNVGDALIDIAVEGEAVPDAASAPSSKAAPSGEAAPSGGDDAPGPLVGSGPVADAVKRRPRRRSGAAAPKPAAATSSTPAPGTPGSAAPDTPTAPGTQAADQRRSAPAEEHGAGHRPLAKPPVRKLARELGIDLGQVAPTGPHGEVTRADLAAHADRSLDARSRTAAQPIPSPRGGTAASFGAGAASPAWSAPEGSVEHVRVKGVRKATAAAMVNSAFSAPHVSLFVDVDATRTMEFVKRLKASRDFQGVKVTPLLIVAKAVLWAAARNPRLNASWAETPDGAEILIKQFVNLGIAAATPRGLVVPNIKDANELSLRELAEALERLAATAREGRTPPADLANGTITITNVGTLGVDTGTPILNPGEAAIVAFGTVRQRPWVVDGEVVPRYVTTVGGSFDHRIVDGDECARFLADVAAILEEPALLLD